MPTALISEVASFVFPRSVGEGGQDLFPYARGASGGLDAKTFEGQDASLPLADSKLELRPANFDPEQPGGISLGRFYRHGSGRSTSDIQTPAHVLLLSER